MYKYFLEPIMEVEEKLAAIISDLCSECKYVRDIDYPTELNAFYLILNSGKRYKVTVEEDEEGSESEFMFWRSAPRQF